MSDHYQAMVDLKRQVGYLSREHLAELVRQLLDESEVNTSVHVLGLVMRHAAMPSGQCESGAIGLVHPAHQVGEHPLWCHGKKAI